MKIRMTEERTGPRWDGRMWPPRGGEIDVSDEEGADVCAAGWAVPVAQPDADVETRAAEEPPAAPEPAAPSTPAVNDQKAAWVAHAVAQGAASADAEAMTKQQLIDSYGNP